MATVLPGSPPSFDRNDVNGTVKALCNYTRTLQENIDFMLGQLQKNLTAVQTSIEGLNSKISGLQNSVGTLETGYNKLTARVAELEQKINGTS